MSIQVPQCSSSPADESWRFVPDAILLGHRRAPQWVQARTPTVHFGLNSRKSVGGCPVWIRQQIHGKHVAFLLLLFVAFCLLLFFCCLVLLCYFCSCCFFRVLLFFRAFFFCDTSFWVFFVCLLFFRIFLRAVFFVSVFVVLFVRGSFFFATGFFFFAMFFLGVRGLWFICWMGCLVFWKGFIFFD